jgi:ferredoxin-NADP reductase
MNLFLSDRHQVAEDTMAFWFEPEKPLHFKPGQFGDFSLVDPPYTDAEGNTRTFSFANAPESNRVMIATRMRESAFKLSLAALPTGSPVQLKGPMGDFVLHKNPERPAVFLVGGIGITPVRSIVEHASKQLKTHRLFVFYANATRARTAFFDDFRAWSANNANLSFVPTLTVESPKEWEFEMGKLDRQMLSRHLSDLNAPVYYVVGPPAMVAAMKELLDDIGIDELQVKSEDFAGY